MARAIKVSEISRDEDLALIKKEVLLPFGQTSMITPVVSTKNPPLGKQPATIPNEISKQIDEKLLNMIERTGSTRFVKEIRKKYLPNGLNFTLFNLNFNAVPDEGKTRTLAHLLYSSSDSIVILPTVKSKLLKMGNTLSEKKIGEYVNMLRLIIDEIENVGNNKCFVGIIPLIPIKFVKPIIELYHEKGLNAFAIDACLKDIFSCETDLRRILSEINTFSPLNKTMIYACNLGYPQFKSDEIRADDFLSLFAYIDIFGGTFKTKGGSSLTGRPLRAKIFSRDRYSYKIASNYAEASEKLGFYANYNTLRIYNREEQINEAINVSNIVGQEKMKKYLEKKPAVDDIAMRHLESIAQINVP